VRTPDDVADVWSLNLRYSSMLLCPIDVSNTGGVGKLRKNKNLLARYSLDLVDDELLQLVIVLVSIF